jgi:hypothetical protein
MKGKDQGINTKVAAPAGKPSIGKTPSQPLVGGLGTDMKAMPGSKGSSTGGAVKTVKSQPMVGKNGNGTSAMGSGGVIPGKI